ncbi:MAG TPA: hypothetical protein VHE30_08210 [Polyangiaceae bacterium]|nr:hypothetical protein [Polyangiaceae bacterium]
MVRPLVWAVCILAACVALTLPAGASVEAESLYTKGQTYNGALRYLRVDLGYEVTEKDPEAAYLLFKFVPTGRKTPMNGSIEIVEQRASVRVYVHLPELPRYHEELLSDGLLRKLRDEYGEPPRRDHENPPRDKKDRDTESRDGGS